VVIPGAVREQALVGDEPERQIWSTPLPPRMRRAPQAPGNPIIRAARTSVSVFLLPLGVTKGCVSNATALASRLLDRYSVHGRRGLRSLGDLIYRLTSGGPHGNAAHMLAALVPIRTPTTTPALTTGRYALTTGSHGAWCRPCCWPPSPPDATTPKWLRIELG
jgi:hypothetical protein